MLTSWATIFDSVKATGRVTFEFQKMFIQAIEKNYLSFDEFAKGMRFDNNKAAQALLRYQKRIMEDERSLWSKNSP